MRSAYTRPNEGFRCPAHVTAAIVSDHEAPVIAERRRAKNREAQARYRARHKPQRCTTCREASLFAEPTPEELEQELAEMKALDIFRYQVPGSSTEYTDWLCATHRKPEESWQWCDACKAPLYFSGAGSPHTRVTDERDEAAEHGYTDILDKPPFELGVKLCPACHDSVEHRRSGSCPGCERCNWKSDSPLHQYDRDEQKDNERADVGRPRPGGWARPARRCEGSAGPFLRQFSTVLLENCRKNATGTPQGTDRGLSPPGWGTPEPAWRTPAGR